MQCQCPTPLKTSRRLLEPSVTNSSNIFLLASKGADLSSSPASNNTGHSTFSYLGRVAFAMTLQFDRYPALSWPNSNSLMNAATSGPAFAPVAAVGIVFAMASTVPANGQ